MAPCAVPDAVADGLGVKAHHHSVLLAHALHEIARHPQVVGSLNALAGAHLVLPLTRHHLGINAAHLHTRKLHKIERRKKGVNIICMVVRLYGCMGHVRA